MNCEERREQFLLDAVGALEPAESQALNAHLATGCTVCAGSAAEALAVAANLAMQIIPVEPDPSVLDRLMQRVSASGQPAAVSSMKIAPFEQAAIARRPSRWFPSLAAAAVAAVLAAVVTAGVMWPQLRDERLLKTPDLRYVSLAGSTPQPKAHGRIFWDADRGYWHVYVFDLAPPAVGKTYELWFIGNDGRKTPAGLFDVNSSGEATIVSKVPGDVGPLAAAAITDEIAGGAAQPTWKIQLLGRIE
jgi:anti-sigma-K factor RskA